MSVLTPEELKCVVVLGSGSAGHRTLIAIIDRLVAEVASLRARNEALEKVAKAAAKLDEWDIGKFMTCEDCGHTDQDAKEIDTAYCAMSASLSALNPSGPNSSGGET